MEKILDLKDLMSACSKVLLVEESLSERKRLVRWLQRHGKTELKGVGSGEALVMLRDENIDLLVLGRVGHKHVLRELVQNARERNPQVTLALVDGNWVSPWTVKQVDGIVRA